MKQQRWLSSQINDLHEVGTFYQNSLYDYDPFMWANVSDTDYDLHDVELEEMIPARGRFVTGIKVCERLRHLPVIGF